MRSIKQKIMLSVVAVVLLALLAGLGFTYATIRGQMREQILSDNQFRLAQTSQMLEYISTDILNLTRSIVADEQVNSLIAGGPYASAADEVNAVYGAIRRMQDYMSMREFVQSIALVSGDGTVLWDKAPFDGYFASIMEQPWYTEGAGEGGRYRFTGRHEVANLLVQEPVLSLVAATVDPRQMGQTSGEVIVNIRFSWLQNYLAADAATFDGFCWLRSGGEVLWQQGEIDSALAQSLLAQAPGENAVHRAMDGYLIFHSTQSNGWTLVSYVTDAAIDAKLVHIPLLFVGVGLFCMLGIALAVNSIVRRIVRPINELVDLMDRAGGGDLSVHASIGTHDEMAVLGEGFNHMVSQLDETITLMLDGERQIRQQEYDLILARMNPHFIYNTLNTVVYLANRDGSPDSARVASSLIVLLQDVIKISSPSPYATLGQELFTIEHYCTIQQYRYPGKFDLALDVPEALHGAQMPKTVLQPLVENALLHGIFPSGRAGHICVGAYLQGDDTLLLEVVDDGEGMDREKVDALLERGGTEGATRHVGLSSIAERIRYLYGSGYGLTFENSPEGGAVVQVRIPYRSQPSDTV